MTPASRVHGRTSDGEGDVLVIFGITGDLARVMTLRSLYRLERRGLLACPVVGVAADPWSTDDLRKYAADSIEATGEAIQSDAFDRLAARMTYLPGDLTDPQTFRQLGRAIAGARAPVYCLSLPPALFARTVGGLHEADLTAGCRVLVEKPFGHDLASAVALADELHAWIDESQIYRVDHFLGKVGFDHLLRLRFGNVLLEPAWNRHHVASVQITLAEPFGVSDRGQFYDNVGALRDVVVNHMLELLAAAAMEPPAGRHPGALLDQQAVLWDAMAVADPAHYVRGQYDGYLSVDGVRPDSQTETYAALRVDIDNWRWSGVPFFLRTGKELPVLQTEVRLVLRPPPRLGTPLLGHHGPAADQVAVRLDPSAGLQLQLSGVHPVVLEKELDREGVSAPTPYEVLLHAAIGGDRTRFSRQDGVEQRWRLVQPLLESPPSVRPYARGSWGPAGADELLGALGPWQQPWVDEEVGHG